MAMPDVLYGILASLLVVGVGLGLPLWLIFGDHTADREISAFVGTTVLAAEVAALAHGFEPAPWAGYVKTACLTVYLLFWAYMMSQGEGD